jgi:hypothetical protein
MQITVSVLFAVLGQSMFLKLLFNMMCCSIHLSDNMGKYLLKIYSGYNLIH